MTETILVVGTASHVGKSTVVAGLCRRLADAGYDVAPFKAQNMSNNARVAATPDGEWGEVGVSQYVQARAARTAPSTDHNPVLLKPSGDGESQLIVDGTAVGHYEAGTYYDEHWDRAREAAAAAHDRLAADADVIVAEGAGSAAEVNLHDRDLANVEAARFADADVLVVGDIERGGVFASLYGTLELMPAALRERVRGCVITKFRGDRSLLAPGVEELERLTDVPVLGVLPYDDPGLPEEDSVSLPPQGERAVVGDDDEVSDADALRVGVPRLPRASNVTDFEPLARVPGVRVVYLPADAALDAFDGIVLPGSKNTVDDLRTLRAAGVGERLRAFDGPIVGVCGGYQMLGERIENAHVEGAETEGPVDGFGLLPVRTTFSREKRVERTTVPASGAGPLAGLDAAVAGYEIHMGDTEPLDAAAVERPLGPQSAVAGDVLGTYLHGLFENEGVRRAFRRALARGRDGARSSDGHTGDGGHEATRSPYDDAAELVSEIDLWLDGV
ncbi:cobyric acid synthase [Halobaculum sp. MBLA0147]|uniref:cobyric acid synthase n=1 Tax=Halobaculum sp. MBLA0147 TaxID=3079934 RepID=UPI00352658FC